MTDEKASRLYADDELGALPSRRDPRDYKLICGLDSREIPDEFKLVMPEVKNQGCVGSCVAHALSTVVEYYNFANSGCKQKMSVGFIYGNRKQGGYTGKGMYIREALEQLLKHGDCHNEDFPYNYEVPFICELLSEQMSSLEESAYQHRITSYYKTDSFESIKESLLSGNPVLVCLPWYKDIKVKDGVVHSDQKTQRGFHAVVIYGWTKDGWKIQNSHGKCWGVGGRAILPYSYPIREAWSFTDSHTKCMVRIKKPFAYKIWKATSAVLCFLESFWDNVKELFNGFIDKLN